MKLGVGLGTLLLLASAAYPQAPPSSNRAPAATHKTASETTPQATTKPKEVKTKETSSADHKYHVRLGGIAVGAGYVSGPFWPYYYPYRYYAPPLVYSSLFWDPYWGGYPGFYPAGYFRPGDGKGEVRLRTDPKNATVLIDGAYAGTADKLKTIWLDPGAYNLTVSMPGREPYEQRIYVLSGKSLKIEAKLAPRNPASGHEEER
jgi:PEGA domain-containing protein